MAKKATKRVSRAAKPAENTVSLLYKGKETVFDIHIMDANEAIDYVTQMFEGDSVKSKDDEHVSTCQKCLILSGKPAFSSAAQVRKELVGMDILIAYKKIGVANRIQKLIDAMIEESGLAKK